MFKWFSILIFTNFILNCNSVNTLWNSRITEPRAAQNLAIINYKEALPLVLFLVTDETGEINLEIPEDILKADLVNRKMVNGTQFTLRDLKTQIFFCREPNSEEECLAPQNFKDSERLQCSEDEELTSTAKVMSDEAANEICGFQKTGFSYKVFYPICASDDYKYKARGFGIYGFCYDFQNKKTLYTRHIIMSPKLLNSKLLLRERQLEYPPEPHITGFVPANKDDIMNARNSASSSSTTPLRPKYGIQRLVPKEDMALGIWQKTTNQLFNFELQHNDLIPIWDEISVLVRHYAVLRNDIKLDITTAVIDNKVGVPASNVQIYNRWAKMVLAMLPNSKRAFEGVVFFMNNFRYVQGEFNYQPHVVQLLEEEMQQYCQTDICTTAFRQRAYEGRVKCCAVTAANAQLFGHDLEGTVNVLGIPGLTQGW